MKKPSPKSLEVDFECTDRRAFETVAVESNWGLWLVLVGWLHLLAFAVCYHLTIVREYHDSTGYLLIWLAELAGVGLLYRLCVRPTSDDKPSPPLQRFIVRVWICYFFLSFNLGSLNTLRGHHLFEFFPAMASLASFGFMMMTFVLSWRYFGAVLVMFASGLLMAAHLQHAYLIFGVAWWLVLNCIGLELCWKRRTAQEYATSTYEPYKSEAQATERVH